MSGDWSDSNRTKADADVFESVRTDFVFFDIGRLCCEIKRIINTTNRSIFFASVLFRF